MNTSTVLVRALLAYSVHEHQAGTATQLHLALQRRSCIVRDNGRGIGLDRNGYVAGLLEQLAARRREVALHGTLPNDAPEIDCDEVLAQVGIWRTAHPGLKIGVVFPARHAL